VIPSVAGKRTVSFWGKKKRTPLDYCIKPLNSPVKCEVNWAKRKRGAFLNRAEILTHQKRERVPSVWARKKEKMKQRDNTIDEVEQEKNSFCLACYFSEKSN